ncbi:MAG: hypothetical protein PHH36_06610 [Sideroxydans sp.]|nr:hypothetical protein [Sideroxydans sp.]
MDIGISHSDNFEQDMFEEISSASNLEGIALQAESRSNQQMAALEWMIVPAIAIYIAKPFIDKFLAKAAEDSLEFAYPRFKATLQSLVVRLFRCDRSKFKTFTSGKGKVVDEGSWLFGIYSVTRSNQRMKFIFCDGMTEDQYKYATSQLFTLLKYHHLEGGSDDITLGIASLPNPNAHEVFVRFDLQSKRWRVVDLIEEIKRIKDARPQP